MNRPTRTTLLGLALLLAGCGVQRQMSITSNPEGALVYLNGQEVGRTPLTHDFLWYGKYDVVVRKEGYQTIRTSNNVTAPWWQWVPFDFVAELVPVPLTDRHQLSYSMLPESTAPASAPDMLQNAEEYRQKLQGAGVQRPAPSTAPTTQAVAVK